MAWTRKWIFFSTMAHILLNIFKISQFFDFLLSSSKSGFAVVNFRNLKVTSLSFDLPRAPQHTPRFIRHTHTPTHNLCFCFFSLEFTPFLRYWVEACKPTRHRYHHTTITSLQGHLSFYRLNLFARSPTDRILVMQRFHLTPFFKSWSLKSVSSTLASQVFLVFWTANELRSTPLSFTIQHAVLQRALIVSLTNHQGRTLRRI